MVDKIDAILSLRPNANFGSTGDEINWEDERTIPTDAEITAEIERLTTAKTNEATAKATAKASGNTKLLALGLTQAEATALTGYTPPVEE